MTEEPNKEQPHSGVYSHIGTRQVDMITEATAKEFKEWISNLGMNIRWANEDILDGLGVSGKRTDFDKWGIRCAYMMDAQAKGIIIYKVTEEWEFFCEHTYLEASRERYSK